MSKNQLIHNPVLHKTMLIIGIVWSFIALDFVYAEEQSYQPQHFYLPPLQKTGTNPMIKQQHKYRSLPDSNTDSSPFMRKDHYNYPPPIQKHGSNPFIKQNE